MTIYYDPVENKKLREMLETLRAEVAALKAENAKLTAELERINAIECLCCGTDHSGTEKP